MLLLCERDWLQVSMPDGLMVERVAEKNEGVWVKDFV